MVNPAELQQAKGDYSFKKDVPLSNGETLSLPSIHISKAKLFVGSAISGMRELENADETTVGSGVYLTSQQEVARGYAKVRVRSFQIPTVYEAEVVDMDILDLTVRAGVEEFAKLWKQELRIWGDEVLPTTEVANEMVREIYKEKIHRVIDSINRNSFRFLKDLTFSFGDLIRKVLTQHGYDGLKTIEGGESGNGVTIGDHDTYVIFDPQRVKMIKEEKVV